MATVSKWTPFGVALDITATASTVTRTSATKYTVKINVSWETYYSGAQTNYGMSATSGGVTKTISAFTGAKRSGGSGSFTGTYSISGNESATKTVTVTFKNFNTDNGDSATKSVSFNVAVPAWTSYTIKYNANGGSGAPGNQTKWKNQTLTLSTTKPTRTGYSFLGWNTSASATSATYAAGGSYTVNAAATLYAVWKANTYTIKYNANGGSGAPGNQTKTYGVTLKLSTTKPTRTNYNFLGWSTSSTATKATYLAGGNYTANLAVTLYAVWELAYTKPKITNFSAVRCSLNPETSEYDIDNNGTYARVKFDWSTCINYEVHQVKIEWENGSVNLTPGGNSGTVNEIIGDGLFSTNSTYVIKVTVIDSGGDTSATKTLNGAKFLIDLKAGGSGIAFGKPAELSDHADFGYKTLYRYSLFGVNPDGNIVEALNPQNELGNTVIGYGNYDRGAGNTNIYGYDIYFGVGNITNPGVYKPYLRRGDSLSLTLRTAGYVTNASKDVTFWIPLSAPIVGSPTVTVSSGTGFILRQGNKYTHGSSATVSVTPSSYSAAYYMFHGIYVTAAFSDITNVTNNDAIGVYWNGTIIFS